MKLKSYTKEPDKDHWISWGDFLKFMSEAVQKKKYLNVHFLPIYVQGFEKELNGSHEFSY